jgi:hypothetical protein
MGNVTSTFDETNHDNVKIRAKGALYIDGKDATDKSWSDVASNFNTGVVELIKRTSNQWFRSVTDKEMIDHIKMYSTHNDTQEWSYAGLTEYVEKKGKTWRELNAFRKTIYEIIKTKIIVN